MSEHEHDHELLFLGGHRAGDYDVEPRHGLVIDGDDGQPIYVLRTYARDGRWAYVWVAPYRSLDDDRLDQHERDQLAGYLARVGRDVGSDDVVRPAVGAAAGSAARPGAPDSVPDDEQVMRDAARLVEDAIDATSELATRGQCTITSHRTAGAILDALIEAGWQPPTRATDRATTPAHITHDVHPVGLPRIEPVRVWVTAPDPDDGEWSHASITSLPRRAIGLARAAGALDQPQRFRWHIGVGTMRLWLAEQQVARRTPTPMIEPPIGVGSTGMIVGIESRAVDDVPFAHLHLVEHTARRPSGPPPDPRYPPMRLT